MAPTSPIKPLLKGMNRKVAINTLTWLHDIYRLPRWWFNQPKIVSKWKKIDEYNSLTIHLIRYKNMIVLDNISTFDFKKILINNTNQTNKNDIFFNFCYSKNHETTFCFIYKVLTTHIIFFYFYLFNNKKNIIIHQYNHFKKKTPIFNYNFSLFYFDKHIKFNIN